MTNYLKLSFVLFILLTPFSVNAQFIKQLKNAAERGVTRAVEKKVESQTEKMAKKQLDKMFKDVYGTDDPSSVPGIDFSKMMESIYQDIEVDESYSFIGDAVLEITSVDEKGKQNDPIQLTSYFSENTEITGLKFKDPKQEEEGTFILIYDFNRGVGISLIENEGKNMRMVFDYDYAAMSAAIPVDSISQDELSENITFEKTGNTKSILGYDCEEYLIESDENTVLYWVTKTSITGNTPFWSQNNPFMTARMKDEDMDLFKNFPTGSMMEAHITSKIDKSVMDMVVLEINENKSLTFQMSDYPSMAQSMK